MARADATSCGHSAVLYGVSGFAHAVHVRCLLAPGETPDSDALVIAGSQILNAQEVVD